MKNILTMTHCKERLWCMWVHFLYTILCWLERDCYTKIKWLHILLQLQIQYMFLLHPCFFKKKIASNYWFLTCYLASLHLQGLGQMDNQKMWQKNKWGRFQTHPMALVLMLSNAHARDIDFDIGCACLKTSN